MASDILDGQTRYAASEYKRVKKGLLTYFALFGDKCITSLRVYPHLHPILKAAMFGINAIEEFLVFSQLKALAITAYTLL